MQWAALIEPYLVEDETFGQAYEAVGDVRRSWLKTQIARLHSWYGRGPRDAEVRECESAEGCRRYSVWHPPKWGLVVVDESVQAPALGIGGILPLLMSGCPEVVVARVGNSDWPAGLLTALELLGIELAVSLPENETSALQNVSGEGGIVLTLGSGATTYAQGLSWLNTNTGTFAATLPRRIGVWDTPAERWDWPALAWLYTGIPIDVWGEPGAEKVGNVLQGTWSDFCAQSYSMVCVPSNMVRQALSATRLALAPGYEYCWCMPEIELAALGRTAMGWAGTQRPQEEL
ncbi:MAG: hypothetical protein ACQESV_01320 [Thermodesulfobacteriota bacterium]